jgi:hypothetical protein
MMRALLILCFLTLSSLALACLVAHQTRIFPLGAVPGGLVVVEMHISRGDKRGDLEAALYKIISYLKVYHDKYRETSSLDLDSVVTEKNVEQIAEGSFKKGLAKAMKMKGITFAVPTYLSFCDIQQKCDILSVIPDTINGNVSLLAGGKIVPVPFVKNTVTSFSRQFGFRYTAYNMNDMANETWVSSIRKFKIGDRELLVVHLLVQTG